VIPSLLNELLDRGYEARIVPIGHLAELEAELHALRAGGLLAPEFYDQELAALEFRPPRGLPGARSLLVIAVPQPQIGVLFTWQGSPLPAIVPPTYLHSRATDAQVARLLSDPLGPAEKIASSGLDDYVDLFPRNLSAIIAGQQTRHQ
jgi:epoxyqueuosine reductase